MTTFSLIFPQGYEDYAWEVESKGWFGEAMLSYSGRNYRLNFYDPARLAQEIDSEIQNGGIFFERNLVIVKSLTKASMESAAAELVESGRIDSLVAD